MRIQHNITAMNSYRNYTNNASALSKNLEKLSSGYKINRAGDDAAGLAISEKMRAQISGLEQAQSNVKDGISLVKTAEGALQEVQDMMNRMVTLATQSANGTYQNEVDRENLQEELTALKTEIDRIAESTNFNGQQLLDGTLASDAVNTASIDNGGKVAYIDGDNLTVTSNAATKDAFVIASDVKVAVGETLTIKYQDLDGSVKEKSLTNDGTDEVKLESLITGNNELNQLFYAESDANANNNQGATTITSRIAGANCAKILTVTNNNVALAKDETNSVAGEDAYLSIDTSTLANGDTFTIGDKTYEYVGTPGTAKKGNIEVTSSDAADIVTTLQKNGVTSASISDGKVKISDLNQIAVDAKGAAVTVDADAGTVYAEAATKSKFDLKTLTDGNGNPVSTTGIDAVGTDNKKQTLTVSILDEKGKARDITIDYTSSSTEGTNMSNILSAMSNNAELNKYFDVDTTHGILTAKTAGANGAQLAGLKTTDTTINSASGAFAYTSTIGEDAKKTLELKDGMGSGTTVTVNGKTYEFVNDGQEAKKGNIAVTMGSNTEESTKNLANAIKNQGLDIKYIEGSSKIEFADTIKYLTGGEGGLTLQIGDTSEEYNQLTVAIENMGTDSLGIADVDISTAENAQDAIEVIKSAINTVSAQRGKLGAIQNRLEHTQNNLSTMTENIQDAESTIRDTDVADEMTEYTKNNILLQSAQAMLAQANQMPQGVLQLLQ